MKSIFMKCVFCAVAFSGGIAWGIAAEAAETGVTLATMFGH
jgi:enoyl-[acyl-carrier-protein] reductase (NADH)